MNVRKRLQSPMAMLACAWLMACAIVAPIFCVPPIMHVIAKELLLTHAEMGLIFSIPLIMLAILAVPSGALADRIGIRRAAGIGVIVIIVGSLLRSTATNFAVFLAFSCLYGAGWGLVYPNLPKLVATWFPPKRIGLATGIYAVGICIGCALPLAITLPVVFPVTNTFQGVFYIWTVPAIVAAIAWWIVVREPTHIKVQSEQLGEENRLHYQIWTNRTLWLVSIIFFLASFAFYIWVGWSPQLMVTKGASRELAAVVTSVIIWVNIPSVLAIPWASDKIGLRKPFVWASFILLALVSLGAIYAPLSLSWSIMAAVGIATGAQLPILLILPAELVPTEAVGRASGMILCIGYIGGLVGPWVTGHVIDITGSLDLALIVLVLLAGVATYLALRLPESGPKVKLEKC